MPPGYSSRDDRCGIVRAANSLGSPPFLWGGAGGGGS